jgi:hypothetical protein
MNEIGELRVAAEAGLCPSVGSLRSDGSKTEKEGVRGGTMGSPASL